MTKKELEAAIALDNLWSGRSTLVLAIGILGEYALLPLLKEGSHKAAKVAFAVLVVAGVVGEYRFSSLISQHAEGLQRTSDKELADATKAAGAAIERASKAELRATELNAEIQPRDLTPSQIREIGRRVPQPSGGLKIQLLSYAGDVESVRLLAQIKDALRPRGWGAEQFNDLAGFVPMRGPVIYGIWIGENVAPQATQSAESKELIRILSECLHPSNNLTFTEFNSRMTFPIMRGAVAVFVGPKPFRKQ